MMEKKKCSSSEPETELGVATYPYTFLCCFPASKMLYHASTMLNAFGFYYAQNYAGIIRQGLARPQLDHVSSSSEYATTELEFRVLCQLLSLFRVQVLV